jgi:hypothetical protein
MSTLVALENVQKPRRQTTSCGETQKQTGVPEEWKETRQNVPDLF